MKAVLLLLIFLIPTLFAANLKGQNQLIEGETSYRFIIKFTANAQVDIEGGKVQSFSRSRSNPMPNITTLFPQGQFKQLISFSPSEKEAIRGRTRALPPKGTFDRLAFSGLVELEGASTVDPQKLLALATTLETYDIIEYVEISSATPPPPPGATHTAPPTTKTAPPSNTPDYSSHQFYLYGIDPNASQVSGIYADYAWSIGITGQGVSIADVEWGWDHGHEDFEGQNNIDELTTTNHGYDDHGTAVMGQMFAGDNGFGVTGAVYGADAFHTFSEVPQGRSTAVLSAISKLEAGDVLVYEMQTGAKDGEYVPADYNQSIWDITKTASDAGIIVVAAAGNGNQNLDEAFYAQYRARGDNGSIIVGAGTKIGRGKATFSTYGTPVDLYPISKLL